MVGFIMILVLLMEKLKYKEVKQFALAKIETLVKGIVRI